jgi:hypothetical protein
MKLFSPRLTTLKSKLYAIVFASLVVRVVAFFVLPNTASNLAPDEGTYAELANWTALGKPATEFPAFGAGLYQSGRSLLLPAALFNKIGFNPLNSVRLTATIYGFLLVCLIVTIILKTALKNIEFAEFIDQNPRIFFSLFLMFVLLPSNFVWSILGLRESATQFWTILAFLLLFQMLHLDKKASLSATCGFLFSIVLTFSARPQVGWVLGVTLLLYLLVRIRNRIARLLIPITALGIFFGSIATVASPLEVRETYLAKEISETNVAKSRKLIAEERKVASSLCNFSGQKVESNNVYYRCKLEIIKESSINLKDLGTSVIDLLDETPAKHAGNKVGAASAIKTLDCPFAEITRYEKYSCIAYRAPYTAYTFLVRPVPGADVRSSSSLLAAMENVFWLAAFVFVIVMLIRNRRLAFIGSLVPSLMFFSIYTVGAGAYEGNMGTAFRHKSLILWVVILLLASTIVATQQKKAEREGISG